MELALAPSNQAATPVTLQHRKCQIFFRRLWISSRLWTVTRYVNLLLIYGGRANFEKKFLSDAGITPSSTKTYTSAEILAALKAGFGYDVIIQCSSSTLDEIYYSYNVRGSIPSGTFVPVNPGNTHNSLCCSSVYTV